MEMPKFNFNECSIKDDAELDKALAATSSGKFFSPGKYEVTIGSVEYKGANKKDPNWGQLEIVLKGTGEKEIKEFLMIPFKDVYFRAEGKKESLFPFKKVQAIGKALGVDLKATNIQETMQTVFGNPKKLIDLPVNITVGYQGAYVGYVGKEEDRTVYNLCQKDGTPYVDEATKEPLKFHDKDSAGVYAEANKIEVSKYAQVLAYDVSASGAPLKADQTPW